MFFNILRSVFGSRNDRVLRKYNNILLKINSLDKKFCNMSDFELKEKYIFIKKNYENMDFLNDVLPHVYGMVREISFRVLGLKHFDVQILGGIALYEKKIIEVATGEGKTLIATLPACLFTLFNKSVHVVTVNDYLAKRDAAWMKPIYDFLDIKVSVIVSGISNLDKKIAYESDLIYGTCNEFGFDYLRDNIVLNKEDKVQKGLFYAIIDEVDSVLIDEARTPLIISLPDNFDSKIYQRVHNIAKFLDQSFDFILDERNKQVQLTECGFFKLEKLLKEHGLLHDGTVLYESSNINLLHDIYSALKAIYFFKKDVDYIIKDNLILIVDEHTGRIMDGRRWSDGLHQALEAKEKVPIKSENQTLASITFQNYFRLYESLSGMTGTAFTEAEEFLSIYGLEVVVIPTNKACIRNDQPDLIFLNKKIKFKTLVDDIAKCYTIGQPVLVGTTSIAISEFLSDLLTKYNIKHNVLNAKNHEKESQIIAEAGRIKSVTIATNMAGRGTDIVLGGRVSTNRLDYENVVKLGGLRVIGTERHESRRIDNQLRGRCGRQGDPGFSQFYLSLEDDLIRIFVGDKITLLLTKLNMSDNEVISHSLINKSIENAQRKVESHNFDIRKQLLEFDDIFNEQRVVFYKYRNFLIFSDDISDIIRSVFVDVVDIFFSNLNYNDTFVGTVDPSILSVFNLEFGVQIHLSHTDNLSITFLKKEFFKKIYEIYLDKKASVDLKFVLRFEKILFLNVLDMKWKEHLSNLEYLKKGIHLRGYAHQDPKQEYKKESFILFENMLDSAKYESILLFLRLPFIHLMENKNFNIGIDVDELKFNHTDMNDDRNNSLSLKKTIKLGRNAACHCESGKKYKHCHGKN